MAAAAAASRRAALPGCFVLPAVGDTLGAIVSERRCAMFADAGLSHLTMLRVPSDSQSLSTLRGSYENMADSALRGQS